MGIDGKLKLGRAIVINPKYCSADQLNLINDLSDKYEDLFLYNRMTNIVDEPIIVWGQEPIELFPGSSMDRRPLIIRSEEQLKMMKPGPKEIDLEQRQLWNPSYEDFIVRLEYPETPEDIETEQSHIMTFISNQHYNLNETDQRVQLPVDVQDRLFGLLTDLRFTLVGKFLIYIAD